MAEHYFLLVRTFWMGGLWACMYLVRPLLDRRGYFPEHGLDVIHWMVGLGLVAGVLIIATAAALRLISLNAWNSRLLIALSGLSGVYFGFMPWWKLQLIIAHAICLLGVVWVMTSPRKAI